MPLLLLASIQIIILKMEIFDSNQDFIVSQSQNLMHTNCSSAQEIILCKHCKRTSNNGIRCLGMCVADNDY